MGDKWGHGPCKSVPAPTSHTSTSQGWALHTKALAVPHGTNPGRRNNLTTLNLLVPFCKRTSLTGCFCLHRHNLGETWACPRFRSLVRAFPWLFFPANILDSWMFFSRNDFQSLRALHVCTTGLKALLRGFCYQHAAGNKSVELDLCMPRD